MTSMQWLVGGLIGLSWLITGLAMGTTSWALRQTLECTKMLSQIADQQQRLLQRLLGAMSK